MQTAISTEQHVMLDRIAREPGGHYWSRDPHLLALCNAGLVSHSRGHAGLPVYEATETGKAALTKGFGPR